MKPPKSRGKARNRRDRKSSVKFLRLPSTGPIYMREGTSGNPGKELARMFNQAGTASASALIISNDRATIQAALCGLPVGHVAAIAYDLPSALLQMSRTSFDFVISELRLPEMHGKELLTRLQTATSTPSGGSGIIFAFSSREWALALEMMRSGAYDCLEKPPREDVWRARLGEAWKRRRREQDKRLIQELLESTLKERTEHLQRALAEVETSRRDTMETLVMALDKREHATHLHSLRVQAFTLLLAEHCGYRAADLQALSYGALLHDIGKIAIPDTIILKPGPLSTDETRLMRQHPILGYQILSRIPHLEEAAEITLRHHERIDGKGYPFGLRGDEVPLSVRIFSVADALDVILSGRAYCTARTIDFAREEMLRCAGYQFDPEVIDVFLSVSPDAWLDVQDEVAAHVSSQQFQPELTIQ